MEKRETGVGMCRSCLILYSRNGTSRLFRVRLITHLPPPLPSLLQLPQYFYRTSIPATVSAANATRLDPPTIVLAPPVYGVMGLLVLVPVADGANEVPKDVAATAAEVGYAGAPTGPAVLAASVVGTGASVGFDPLVA